MLSRKTRTTTLSWKGVWASAGDRRRCISASFARFPKDVQTAASNAEHALSNNYQIPLISKSIEGLDQAKAYEIAAALRALRESKRGHAPVGRKIGFTNRRIWPEYGIDASNWSYMYPHTVVELADSRGRGQEHVIDISHLSALEPKIEPEIVLGLASPVRPGMSDIEILRSVAWIAHGFEVVASIFAGWRFTAADTTAAFALHALLLVGPKKHLQEIDGSPETLLRSLENFTVRLHRNGRVADEGSGSNVLGSPVRALRHLAELLEADAFNPPLAAGEIVTTGTLTRALSIAHHDVWATTLDGIELPGLEVKFGVQPR